jgi:hypothetical protein
LNQIRNLFFSKKAKFISLYVSALPTPSFPIDQEDKFVGASIASFQLEDTTKMVYFYDGKVKILSGLGKQNNSY